MLFRFCVPCLFRFAASLLPGSGVRRYTVQPGSILDRMQPEGVAEKLGGCRVDGCRDILTHFQIQPEDLCCDERGVGGGGKEAGRCFGFRCRKLSKAFGGLLRRNRLKAADGRESGRSDGLVKGEKCLVSVRGVTKCAEQNEKQDKTKRGVLLP